MVSMKDATWITAEDVNAEELVKQFHEKIEQKKADSLAQDLPMAEVIPAPIVKTSSKGKRKTGQ